MTWGRKPAPASQGLARKVAGQVSTFSSSALGPSEILPYELLKVIVFLSLTRDHLGTSQQFSWDSSQPWPSQELSASNRYSQLTPLGQLLVGGRGTQTHLPWKSQDSGFWGPEPGWGSCQTQGAS